jgi:glycine cleavage system transcriptional repressor
MSTYIVTVTTYDRVGIVHAVTGAIRDQGGNIQELSQTVVRDYFTIILAVEFDGPRDPRALRAAIEERGRRFDLHVAVIEPEADAGESPVPHGERFILTVLGADHPGTIHGISGCLAASGVNIIDLHARSEPGGRFALIMEAFLPPALSPGEVRAELERFGRERGLEAFVQHENIFLATNEAHPVRVGPAPNPEGAAVVPH